MSAHDRRDFDIRTIGCLACRLGGVGFTSCEKHHLNFGDRPGGKRLGEKLTIGLCQWHHRGICFCTLHHAVIRNCPTCYRVIGPSWVHHRREFTERYGSGEKLLEIQDKLIAKENTAPWTI